MSKITVLGSGGWGTALAVMAAKKGHHVTLWSPFDYEITALESDNENKKYLPGVAIPKNIILTSEIKNGAAAELYIIASPSFAVRETAKKLRGVIANGAVTVNVAKGLEKDTLLRMSQVIEDELPEVKAVTLSGPSHAEEVALGVPTSIVAASKDKTAAEYVQDTLMNDALRIYTSDDIIGVELGGMLKNVIALAAGVTDGLGLGDNSKAALITRGLTEIARLGVKMGAKRDTFAGLTGLGDLVVTCTSMHSRNRRFGILVGQSVPANEALKQIGMTVEGYHATENAYALAEREDVEMPITEQCYSILYKGTMPRDAIRNLMGRPKKHENEQTWLV
ncbi:MAG TPA: NAD(P)H-dependent glycerol-3-phosphate dehydrogenase [Ruminococcaceae bacterium]|nr:NAD(P)H-dependent glycerol-3-phosphate dehydrogenase [Oscillospiraceae bacterium]